MKLPSPLIQAFERWSDLRKDYALRKLKDMPTSFLVVIAGLTSFGSMLTFPRASQATEIYINQILPNASWKIDLALGIWLFSIWALMGFFTLLATSHGRALADRWFDSATPSST